MARAIDSVVNFLTATRDQHNAPDLIDRFLQHGRQYEIQVNVFQGRGERVEGKRSTYRDNQCTYFNYRVPHKADTTPEFRDFELKFPLDPYLDGIGSTGWDWVDRCSRYVGFDFDSIVGHATGVGVTKEELQKVQEAAAALPYVEVRRSTGGAGLHLYVPLDAIPTANHVEHAAIARAVLGVVSRDAGFDFSAQIDACGGILWLWHRKMTAANEGLMLLKSAEGTGLVVPNNWRDHLDVICRRRARVRLNGVPDAEEDVFEQLASAHRRITLDDIHKAIIEELAKTGATVNWVDDHHLLQTHTMAFDRVMNGLEPCPVCGGIDTSCPNCTGGQSRIAQRLGLKGLFQTNSKGKDPGSPNCFAFPLDNGAWKVFRFSPGVAEAPTWDQDGQGYTTCLFNIQIDLKVAARSRGGSEMRTGGYEFGSIQEAIEVAQLINPSINFPVGDEFADRETVLRTSKDGKLIFEMRRDKNDTKPGTGWNGSDKRNTWTQVVTAGPPPTSSALETINYDNAIRCLETSAQNPAGWSIKKEDGTWTRKNASSVKTILQDAGHSKPEAEQLMGRAERRTWKLVSLPFQPEYPGNRQWNVDSPQLRVQPISRDEEPNCPHWELILEHIGADLTPYLAKLDWAIQSGIRTGGDYLRALFASIIREPLEHTPYIFLFGEENSGKSILHEAFSLLVTSGVVKADRALTSRSDFNGELAGAILCVVEEKDIGKTPGALAKIKDAVTAEFLSIRKMRMDSYMCKNFTHWIQCNNDFSSCPVFPGDSRITVIHVPRFAGPEIPKRQMLRLLEEEASHFLRTLIDMILPPATSRLRIPIVETDHKQRIQDLTKSSLDTFLELNVEYDEHCMILFAEFFDRFLTWLPSEELSKWSRAYVSRCLPTKFKTSTRTSNKTYVMHAKWTPEKYE